jgi:hypothetical protein
MDGTVILVLLVLVLSASVTLGADIRLHPKVCTLLRLTRNGSIPTSFISALFAASSNISIVGPDGHDAPHICPLNLLHTFHAIVGMCFVPPTLISFLHVHSTVQRRNAIEHREKFRDRLRSVAQPTAVNVSVSRGSP